MMKREIGLSRWNRYFNSTLQVPLVLSSFASFIPSARIIVLRRTIASLLYIESYRFSFIRNIQRNLRSCSFQHGVKRPYCAWSMDVSIIWRSSRNSGYRSRQQPDMPDPGTSRLCEKHVIAFTSEPALVWREYKTGGRAQRKEERGLPSYGGMKIRSVHLKSSRGAASRSLETEEGQRSRIRSRHAHVAPRWCCCCCSRPRRVSGEELFPSFLTPLPQLAISW